MTTHVVHYIIADNDLDIAAIKDISKLISRSGCILDILVLVKSSALFLHIDKHAHIKELRMKNLDAFYSLTFWKKIISRYRLVEKNVGKTEKILLMSGHGSGWFMHGDTVNYGDKQVVHMNDVRAALDTHDVTLDILCMDCCFSSSIEIIYEIGERSRYFVASQEYMYWEGLCGSKICENAELWQKTQDIAADFMLRSGEKKESACITIVDMEKFRPLMQAYLPKLQLEDFRPEFTVDMCEIWLKDCPKCDPRECDIFYDFYSTVLASLARTGEDSAEFATRYREAVQFHKNEFLDSRLNITGVNLASAIVDVGLIKKPLYMRTYKKMRIFRDPPR